MKVSLNWLKNYVTLPAGTTAQELALKLTMSTVEVEGVEEQGKNLEGIVVGKVQKVSAHPNADKLKVCQVDIGEKLLQVVCGGSNVKENMLVALAKIGSRVKWHGEGELIELKPATIRGVDSEGMICAAEEIGLDERFPAKEEKEILNLSSLHRLKPGMTLSKALGLDDTIIEIDNKSMTNRPDLWGHYGLSREIAALYRNRLAKYNPPEIKPGKEKKISVEVEDFKMCPRYMVVEVGNVRVAPSPPWLQEKLLAVGLRPINNIVDITNYVMLDLGEPLHAFDANLFKADKIIVRKAKDGEEFITLDHQKHKSDSSMLMIADKEKAVALAGVMGCLDSGISAETQKVVFEAANFEAFTIRHTAVKLGLRTDASARFEKSLDPNLCALALRKAVQLTLELCPEAVVTSNVADESHFYLQQGPMEISLSFLNKKIGLEMDKKQVVGILERLGFVVKTKKDLLSVAIPTWRATKDISIPEDLVEEVARIYGYDNIKTSLPSFSIIPPEKNILRGLENQVRELLVLNQGYTEVYNYSFISAAEVQKLGDKLENYVALDNPLSKEKPFLRRHLLTNLLENTARNLEYVDELKILEIGKTFLPEKPGIRAGEKSDELLPRQDSFLNAVFAAKKNVFPFKEVRAAAEVVLQKLGYKWQATELPEIYNWQHPTRSVGIEVQNVLVGQIYEVNPLIVQNFGLEEKVGVLEINLTELSEKKLEPAVFEPVPIYPEIVRDLAVVLSQEITHAEIVKTILEVDPLLKKVELFDVYEGENIKKDFKSMAYHLILANQERTLTANEAEEALNKVIKTLQNKFKAEVRS
ncbi:MAG TPA: phenylalanine--tRNA ligase subunit beta [Candidatus Magasanikbacteria bacterium]|uniref:Phenylalanine--tRNA ligase beta subunit n=1 Tax=Candidatus Magasanikbacteria bacterium GW2011_GWA2_42_32 TaxID=1619039 RepID=A0A0G1A6Q5_9BACT|nr:MAG: Phenylalanine-tRNA ligase beta subunit [Candidatus Magasanikbacteria bacterium GW2011_GWC2_40_17]KKS56722.1 MAG: Phenylalanine-tRNA ligase beta subunit [Candidatus Magasanikbacteria bacterium GW2011_GWA2_42_32]OGH85988.1 MAG: phenylalanine--tRNA ligase subunit beta [Candidatus Magasanikbacteria bacterium RIFOXYB2_FULL_38_10]HBV58024.1 phenylalanine--tRNA ligase subunit beta [Candidatus Magasanikbacteria bacterium]